MHLEKRWAPEVDASSAMLDGMRTGLLLIDAAEQVLATNAALESLFGVLAVPGKSWAVLVDEAAKYGLVSEATAARLAGMPSDGLDGDPATGQLFEMKDERSVMVTARPLLRGEVLLEFTDVSSVVQTTLREQRDVLTGLANRLELSRRLSEALAAPAGPAPAVLYIDLDRFKMVNDTLGHPVGDALLKLVGERISRLLAPGDVLARVGGDEFTILQADSDPLKAEALAARLIEIVGRTYLIQGHSVQVGASAGIALAPADGSTPLELLRNADLALFSAKSGGRGTFRFFASEMDEELRARRALEIDLRKALAMREFSLVYQPQFQIEGTRLIGFEALIRWTSPERGPVSPGQFIPLAEEIGLIGPIGEWVLRTACHEAARWPDALSVSVNLSPLEFKSPKLVSMIASALANAGLSPARLELEITEGALMDDTEAVVTMLRQIKALGVRVSMDDFGTGYSSLSYLQKFPFDKIKIDQSFVRSLETNPESAAIVRAVTALGASLGMVTIAEGVETETQLLQITRDGCEQVQGFLTGRPLAGDAVSRLIEQEAT